jgi:hypothetical protein
MHRKRQGNIHRKVVDQFFYFYEKRARSWRDLRPAFGSQTTGLVQQGAAGAQV